MATPWTTSIRQRGQLSVYVTPSSTRGLWGPVIRHVVQDFNSLSRRYRLGVRLIPSTRRATQRDGADVCIDTAFTSIAFTYDGSPTSESFDGRVMHGRTFLVSRDGKVEKAFVFLPSQPQINTPQGLRTAGTYIMEVIAVHELVHACGLGNEDHSTDDLFQGNPQVDPGDTAGGDRVRVQVGGTMSWMPPLVLSGATTDRIRGLWAR